MSDEMTRWAAATAGARGAVVDFDVPGVQDVAAAYDWQRAYTDAVMGASGRVSGFKLAVNGKPQMAHFGVTEPAWARIFSDEIYQSGAAVSRAGFSSVSIEPELAAILGDAVENLSGPVNRKGALEVIAGFHGAIELIDQRNMPLSQVTLPQAIALNVFNAGIVLGAQRIAPDDLDVSELHVALRLNGETVAETVGTAPQDPVEAVAWLLNQLLAQGIPLHAGMVVMCGTHLPLRVLETEVNNVAVDMTALGTVSFSLID